MELGYSATFSDPHGCHCNRKSLYVMVIYSAQEKGAISAMLCPSALDESSCGIDCGWPIVGGGLAGTDG